MHFGYGTGTLTVLALYTIPVLAILYEVIPFELRFMVLCAMAGLLAAFSGVSRAGFRVLGLRLDNLTGALLANSIFVAVVAVAIFWRSGNYSNFDNSNLGLGFYVFYVLISSPAQEFLYRSFLYTHFAPSRGRKALSYLLVSATLYSFVHVIYKDIFILAGTFVLGLIWGVIYLWRPNFWGVAFSHAAIGAISIHHGMV